MVTGTGLLMVLDNAATEEQSRLPLPGSPSVMVAVTSRDALAGLVALGGAGRMDLDLPVGLGADDEPEKLQMVRRRSGSIP